MAGVIHLISVEFTNVPAVIPNRPNLHVIG